jgi:hypothetical protein
MQIDRVVAEKRRTIEVDAAVSRSAEQLQTRECHRRMHVGERYNFAQTCAGLGLHLAARITPRGVSTRGLRQSADGDYPLLGLDYPRGEPGTGTWEGLLVAQNCCSHSGRRVILKSSCSARSDEQLQTRAAQRRTPLEQLYNNATKHFCTSQGSRAREPGPRASLGEISVRKAATDKRATASDAPRRALQLCQRAF